MDPDDQSPKYEIASVLFMDIVGYSLQPIDRQTQLLSLLQKIVRESSEFQQAHVKNALISLPAGDGMALVFLRDPVSPVKCALETARSLESHPQIKLRMGLHTGPICRHADIKDEINVVGGGINTAQRVMDCGDSGHILLSRNVAEVLQQLSEWRDCLQDLGEHEVKHGVKVHLFNLCKDGLGNPTLPRKCRAPAPITLAIALESFFGSSQKEGQQTTAKPSPRHIRAVTLVAGIFALVAVGVGIPLITNSELWYRALAPGGPSQPRIHEFRIVSISRDVEPGSALGEYRCSHRAFMARLLNKLAKADNVRPRLVVIDKWYGKIPPGGCAPGQDGTPALSKAIKNVSAKVPVLIAVGSYNRDELKQQCPALGPEVLHPEEVVLANYEHFDIAEKTQQPNKTEQGVKCQEAPTGRVSFGLARINADLRKIPLGWPVFCNCSGVEQGQLARPWPTLATAATTVLDPSIMKGHDLAGLQHDLTHPYTKLVREGAKNGFESVSAIKLICNQADPEVEWTKCSDNEGDASELAKLDGKVIVIGETWNDVHRTSEGVIDGPTLQANYIAALLSGGLLRPAPEWVKYITSFSWLALTFWIFFGWKPHSPEVAVLVSVLSTVVLAVLFNAVITRQMGIFADAVPPTILTILAITGLYLARRIVLLLESRR